MTELIKAIVAEAAYQIAIAEMGFTIPRDDFYLRLKREQVKLGIGKLSLQ